MYKKYIELWIARLLFQLSLKNNLLIHRYSKRREEICLGEL